jgi:hypothetical protein
MELFAAPTGVRSLVKPRGAVADVAALTELRGMFECATTPIGFCCTFVVQLLLCDSAAYLPPQPLPRNSLRSFQLFSGLLLDLASLSLQGLPIRMLHPPNQDIMRRKLSNGNLLLPK